MLLRECIGNITARSFENKKQRTGKTMSHDVEASAVCIFAKPPIAGRTKSRLAAGIGESKAAQLAAAMLTDILNSSLDTKSTKVYLWRTPGSEISDFGKLERDFGDSIVWKQQRGDDLGERMATAFEESLRSHQNCIVIGSDCVTVNSAVISEVIEKLDRSDLVLQPATDGGYTLISASKLYLKLFTEINWGSPEVLPETLASAKQSGISVELLAETFDVDDLQDLQSLEKYCRTATLPNCRKWLSLNTSLLKVSSA